jgi:hypothetical protein
LIGVIVSTRLNGTPEIAMAVVAESPGMDANADEANAKAQATIARHNVVTDARRTKRAFTGNPLWSRTVADAFPRTRPTPQAD